jgi:hypothetical protein
MDSLKEVKSGFCLDQIIKSFGFDQFLDESSVYRKRDGNMVIFLVKDRVLK